MDKYLPLITGKNVAVVANHTSLVNDLHLVDTLNRLGLQSGSAFRIKKVFSPEHGFSGYFDAGAQIDREDQLFSTLEIISLYGKNKKPTPEDLAGIDIVLFDLQDVGVRFFTYISTLHYVMQACAENDIPLIVLDRPNPHTHYIDGPILEKHYQSFIGMHPVPVVYGMTIGEYAHMINGEGWLGDTLSCDLEVIKVNHYTRKSFYTFPIKPSPNLPNMESVILYPSTCFFEGTIMSEGRGTPSPFQVFGHPDYPETDFSFTPVSTPGASIHPKLQNQVCYGLDLTSISIDSLRSTQELKIEYVVDAYKKMGERKDFFTDYFTLLAGTTMLQEMILQGRAIEEIRASWQPGLNAFKITREKYLLYE
jgi:uncharacterized protein YbbC (DUF1343 family)